MRKILYATFALLLTACPTTGEIGPPGTSPPADDDDGINYQPLPTGTGGAGGEVGEGGSEGGSGGAGGETGQGGSGGEEPCPEGLEQCKEDCYADYLSCKQDCWDTYGNCGAFWECKQDCKDVKGECKEKCDNVCCIDSCDN